MVVRDGACLVIVDVSEIGQISSTLLAALVFRERLGAASIAGIALGLVGVAVVVLHRPGAGLGRASIGDAMIGASVLSFAMMGVLPSCLPQRVRPGARR